jgi:pilus assembly protein Flp/PilA
MIEKIKNFLKDEAGVTSVEYAVMAALIALVVIAGATYLGNQTNDTFNTIGDQVPGGGSTTPPPTE